jgi:ribosomal protein L12E/L44/L45/RPP1/RPP2
VIQVNRATLNAMADEVDDVRIQVFNRYLKDLQKLINNSKTQAAGQMAQAGGNAAAAGALQAAPNLGAPSPAPASMPAPMAA